MFWQSKKVRIPSETEIEEFLSRGVVDVIDRNDFKKRLQSGDRLRIKLGIDPTSPNIHIGRAVVLWKMKFLESLGHQIVLIIGDFTGVIGDTSDKDSERPMLDSSVVSKNMENYFSQMGKVVDISRAEKHYNSKWLSKLTYKEIGEQADQFSVSDFIARDNIKRRLDAGTRVSLREVLYPLMQGYDSVALSADVELGGNDQRFNLLAGRKIQPFYKQKPQQIMLLELLPGLDGRKMSSSWGNTINLNDSPTDMFGKTMRLADELIAKYFLLATNLPINEVKEIEENLKNSSLHPRDAKIKLAKTLVAMYCGEMKAVEAEKNFIKTFTEGGVPIDIATAKFSEGQLLVDFLIENKIIESKSEFSRLILQNAVIKIGENSELIKIVNGKAPTLKGVYRIGKHRFIKAI